MAGERYGDKMETIHNVRGIEIVNGRLLLPGDVPPETVGGIKLPAFSRGALAGHFGPPFKDEKIVEARIPRRRSPSSAEPVPRKFLYI